MAEGTRMFFSLSYPDPPAPLTLVVYPSMCLSSECFKYFAKLRLELEDNACKTGEAGARADGGV